ncbi:MAG: alpha-amylase family glycosyl hydrolase [Paludibacter sp.]|nr:alpha-amylase family glycosyl hydrolase [Paludibacter sp.]
MKKSITFILALFLSVFSWAQIVTTNPTFVTQDAGTVEITFDAASTLGSLGLNNYTGDIYAHIGVITSLSTSSADWKYVVPPTPTGATNSWPTATNQSLVNLAKNKLTSLGNNKYKLTISPSIREYFGVPTGETIQKIAVVFRNADGTKTGKTASSGDIFIDVYSSGLNVAFTNPSTNQNVSLNSSMDITLSSSIAASLNLLINGTSVKTATNATTLSHSYTFASANDYTLIASATVSGTTVYDTVQVCVPASVTSESRPSGLKDGINYINNTTATLILNAPSKSSVFLLGDFNNWSQLNAYQLKKDGDYWWITLTDLTPGKIYGFQYLIDGTIKISDPYTEMVLDPSDDKWINQYYTIFPNLKAYPDGKTVGLVATLQTEKPVYNWEIPSFTMPSKENMVIYELLLRDFTPEKSLDAAILKLDYLKNLGITAVELMPIQEFDGNNSWGYNPNHYFAPDKAYGNEDTYKKFIDECHKRGIAVILDMVFNQATGNCPFALLYWDAVNNRPATDNPWMNSVAPHQYSVYNDFNHSSTKTKAYFNRVLQYWITEYHVDGYRMDLTKGFTQSSGTESTYDQTRIDILSAYYDAAKSVKSDVMFILEHFCTYSEESALANKGMYLWSKSNEAFSEAAMGYKIGSQGNSDFSGMISSPRNWVGYAESHDEERNFYKAKMYGDGTIKTDSIVRINRVPLNIAFATLLPGPKMIWEFEEMGYDYSINWGIVDGVVVNNSDHRTDSKPSAWGYLDLAHRKAAYEASSKIITLRKMYPTAFTQGTFSTQVGTDDWSAGKRIALSHTDLNMIVLGNFNSTATANTSPSFQKTGTWYNLISGQELNVSNTSMTITLQPGELQIYTDRKIDFPNAVNNPVVDNDCFVYPTTTNSSIYISSPNTVESVMIYSLQGAVIKQTNFTTEIDVTNLSNGMYILQVETSKGKSIHKIIKD